MPMIHVEATIFQMFSKWIFENLLEPIIPHKFSCTNT